MSKLTAEQVDRFMNLLCYSTIVNMEEFIYINNKGDYSVCDMNSLSSRKLFIQNLQDNGDIEPES